MIHAIERMPTGISGFLDEAGLHIGDPLPGVAHVLAGAAAFTDHPPWPADSGTGDGP
jgi:hypothetical protein